MNWRRIAGKRNYYLVALLVLVALLWPTPLLAPLKILVVWMHESSHALMTLLTGGEVIEMVVTINQGGHVQSLGGNRFMTLSAGYLGSLLWGVCIYAVTVYTERDRVTSFFLGLAVILITLVFVRNLFGLSFGLLTGAGMLVLAKWASNAANDFVLRLIALASMIYPVLDIYDDTISRSYLRSDARMLAEEVGGFTLMWGGIWIGVSILTIIMLLRIMHRPQSTNNSY